MWPKAPLKPVDPHQRLVELAAFLVEQKVREIVPNKGKWVEAFQKAVDGKAQGEPWCMSMVWALLNWVATETGKVSPLYRSEHCQTVWKHSPMHLRDGLPRAGSLMLWEKIGTFNGHVGIIERVEHDIIHTIEGNVSENQQEGVFRKQRTVNDMGSYRLLGFLRPWDSSMA